jgi:hypothetical protein
LPGRPPALNPVLFFPSRTLDGWRPFRSDPADLPLQLPAKHLTEDSSAVSRLEWADSASHTPAASKKQMRISIQRIFPDGEPGVEQGALWM